MTENIEHANEGIEGKNENKENKENLGISSEILRELHTQNKRMAAIIYSLLIMIVAIIAGFLVFLYQYDFATYDIISETGNANYIGNDGDIMNGTDSSQGAN